jgi:hypothetical protein
VVELPGCALTVLSRISSPKPAFAIFKMASLVNTVCARQTAKNTATATAIVGKRLIILEVYHLFALSLKASSVSAPGRGFHASE